MILSDSEKKKTFSAGYYDEFTVTGDFTALADVTFTYSHHIHSLETDSLSEENDTADKTSVVQNYAENYQSSTPLGCFTQPYYYYSYSQSVPVGTIQCGWTTAFNNAGTEYCYWACPYCGSYGTGGMDMRGAAPVTHHCGASKTTYYSGWTTDSTQQGIDSSKTVYIKACGRSNGDVTDIHIHY